MFSQRPIIPFVVSLAAGILTARLVTAAFCVSVPLMMIFLAGGFIGSELNQKKLTEAMALLFIFMAGFVHMSGVDRQVANNAEITSHHHGGGIEGILARQVQPRGSRAGSFDLVLETADKTPFEPGKGPRVRVYYQGEALTEKVEEFQPGDRVNLRVNAPGKDSTGLNPGEMDLKTYFTNLGISRVYFLQRVQEHKPTGRFRKFYSFFSRTRRGIRDIFHTYLPEPGDGLMTGLILGQRRELSPEIEKALKNTGTLHIMAASGLHVGIVAGFSILFLRLLRVSKRLALFLSIIPVVMYGFLTGWSISITRASIMAVLMLLAMALWREYDPLSALFSAAVIMLLISPGILFTVGFQLSFTAVLGIILMANPVKRLFPSAMSIEKLIMKGIPGEAGRYFALATGWTYRSLVTLTGVSLGAYLFVLPLTARYFHLISLMILPGNILLVPSAGLLMPMGLTAGLLGQLWPQIGGFILSLLVHPVNWIATAILSLGNMPLSSTSVATPGWGTTVAYYIILILLASNIPILKSKNKAIKIFMILLLTGVIALWFSDLNRDYRAVFFETDSAGALLIHGKPGNHLILRVPAGDSRDLFQDIKYKIIPYIKSRGIDDLDTLTVLCIRGGYSPDGFPPEMPPARRTFAVGPVSGDITPIHHRGGVLLEWTGAGPAVARVIQKPSDAPFVYQDPQRRIIVQFYLDETSSYRGGDLIYGWTGINGPGYALLIMEESQPATLKKPGIGGLILDMSGSDPVVIPWK